jgi:predicted transcriptional regulator
MEINERVRNDALFILKQILKYIDTKNFVEILRLSDYTIHSASVFQDKISNMLAISTYSLGYMLQNEKVRRKSGEEFFKFVDTIREMISVAINQLEKNDIVGFDIKMKQILREIARMDFRFGEHIEFVIKKAKLEKATKIIEHGISTGRVADILGLNEWELMEYLGERRFHDNVLTITKSVEERMNTAKKLFKSSE